MANKKATKQGQQLARTIINRIGKEPAFRRMLLKDPSTALALAGLGKDWERLASRHKDPVKGTRCGAYRTCIRSACIGTCVLTKKHYKESATKKHKKKTATKNN